MASTKVIANISGQALIFTTPKHLKGKVTAINIANQAGSAVTIKILDNFTPDPSAAVATPAVQIKTRFQTTLYSGVSSYVQDENLIDIECLGSTYAEADHLDSGVVIVVNYHFE